MTLRAWLRRLVAPLTRRRDDRDLDDEIRHHLDLLAADYERCDLARDAAGLAARQSFGRVEPTE